MGNGGAPAEQAGIRVVHLRFGVVLGPGHGALQQMLPPFRLGLGARLGSGRQWMSWVALADVVAATLFALESPGMSGPLNVTAPNPVTNAEFTRALGRQLRRPAFLAVPAFAVRMMFGQMADEALLASARVHPAKLQAAGFRFALPEIDVALKARSTLKALAVPHPRAKTAHGRASQVRFGSKRRDSLAAALDYATARATF